MKTFFEKMTIGSMRLYHRGYRKGDIINIKLKNSNTYSTCIYSYITSYNEVAMYYNKELLYIPRIEVQDVILVQKYHDTNK